MSCGWRSLRQAGENKKNVKMVKATHSYQLLLPPSARIASSLHLIRDKTELFPHSPHKLALPFFFLPSYTFQFSTSTYPVGESTLSFAIRFLTRIIHFLVTCIEVLSGFHVKALIFSMTQPRKEVLSLEIIFYHFSLMAHVVAVQIDLHKILDLYLRQSCPATKNELLSCSFCSISDPPSIQAKSVTKVVQLHMWIWSPQKLSPAMLSP